MSKLNMVNKEIININELHDKKKKKKFYNELVYLLYGVDKDCIFFKDNKENINLVRKRLDEFGIQSKIELLS